MTPGYYTFYDQFGSNYGSFLLIRSFGGHNLSECPEAGWYWQSKYVGREADARPEGPFPSALAAMADASPNHSLVVSAAFPTGQAEPAEATMDEPACQDGAKAEPVVATTFTGKPCEYPINPCICMQHGGSYA